MRREDYANYALVLLLKARDPHISITAHTTREDLHTYLTDNDIANGLANRFVTLAVAAVLPRVDNRRRPVADLTHHVCKE